MTSAIFSKWFEMPSKKKKKKIEYFFFNLFIEYWEAAYETQPAVKYVKKLLSGLPRYNIFLLHTVFELLNRVSKKSSENKMETKNLGIVFGPSLIMG